MSDPQPASHRSQPRDMAALRGVLAAPVDRRLRGPDPDRAGRVRSRLPGAAQPRRGDDPGHRRDRRAGRSGRAPAGPGSRSRRRSRWRSSRSRSTSTSARACSAATGGISRRRCAARRASVRSRPSSWARRRSSTTCRGCTTSATGSSVLVREIDETGYAPLRASAARAARAGLSPAGPPGRRRADRLPLRLAGRAAGLRGDAAPPRDHARQPPEVLVPAGSQVSS